MKERLTYTCYCKKPATWFFGETEPESAGLTHAAACCDEHLLRALHELMPEEAVSSSRTLRAHRNPNARA